MPTTPSAGHRGRVSVPLLVVSFITGLVATGLIAGLPMIAGDSASASASSNTAPVLPRGTRIPWEDGSYFLAGVNYPQYQYYGGDIGTLSSVDPDCVWAYSSSFDYAAIDADFAEMQAHGAHVVRWWLFGDGRGAPEFDANRMVTGFDATFFDHMDQAMKIAERHNIYIIWTLWDFLAFEHANWLCGGTGLSQLYAVAAKLPPQLRDALLAHLKLAQAAPEGWTPGTGEGVASGQGCMIYAGGHRNLVTDTTVGGAQDTFFNNALIPMLQRYAGNHNIIGWEIMNEPEWTLNPTKYTGQQLPTVTEPVDVDKMQAFFSRFTQAVHKYAPAQYATVGSASLKFMGLGQNIPPGIWTGLGFDYYGAHYYGWMDSEFNNGSPMTIDYDTTQKQLDAPVVIGEFPANGGSAPVYLPSVRRSITETSTLSLRSICTAYAPGGDPPCTRPYTATIEYDNPNGTVAMLQTVILPPYGGWSGPVPANNFTGAARILSKGPVAAAITQTGILSAGEEVIYSGQDQANLTNWLPRITNQGTHRSRIAIQNTGVHTATVTIRYYETSGTEAATSTLTLAPHGSALIDPLLPGSPPGPPLGFQGSAVIVGSWPLIATAYELDPQLGSDAYNGEGQGYQHTVYLPSVRNSDTNGTPTLYVQNPCCAAAQVTINYYSSTGALAATQTLTLPAYGSAVVDPRSVLPGGFEGAAIITSDQYPAAVMRSVTTTGSVSTTELYAGTQNPDQRLHFPVVHSLNGDGSGQNTTFTVQNVSASTPITVWVTLNDESGTSVFSDNSIVIPPQGQWVASASALPGVPAGFSGTAEVLWPWPSATGWQEGFPLLATALDIDSAHTHGSTYRGIVSHSQYWAVTPYSPQELLEGIYAKHWAGALGWSFYEQGTGNWDDFQDAIAAFDAAHPADVRIGQSVYTPVPTPGNGGTMTALAATNTPAYGNSETATAVAQQTGTPQPPCPTCAITFSDVSSDSTFYPFIRCLACRGILGGYDDGTFKPANNMTRGQVSKVVSNAAGFLDDVTGQQTYTDVPLSNTFWLWIERLSLHGVMGGYDCGGPGEPCDAQNRPYFRFSNNITRGQVSKIVSNAAGYIDDPAGQMFTDVPVGHPFYLWVQRLASRGTIGGYPCGGVGEPCDAENRGYFRSGNNVTRGQAAKIVANTFFPDCQTP